MELDAFDSTKFGGDIVDSKQRPPTNDFFQGNGFRVALRIWYNFDMHLQTFRELLTQRPFKPFRVVMSSGQTYEVRHPEMAFLTRTDLLVGIKPTKDGVPAEFRICSLLHVTTVEPLDLANAQPT